MPHHDPSGRADPGELLAGKVVMRRRPDGKLEIEKATDHSTKKGMKWGLVGGAALGLVFPPSIIGSAVALGAGGAALGKAHQLHDKIGLEKDLSDAVAPGHSGIVALVSDPGAVQIREALVGMQFGRAEDTFGWMHRVV